MQAKRHLKTTDLGCMKDQFLPASNQKKENSKLLHDI